MSKKSGITSTWRLLNKISFLNTSDIQNHALVVVNFGQGSGFEIFDLAEAIKKRVQEIFDLELCAEVVIVK